MPNEPELARLLEQLRRGGERERAEAARALPAQGERALPHLVSLLEEAAPGELLAAAAYAAGALGDAGAVPALGRAYRRARSDLHRLPIVRALGALGAPAFPLLVEALGARDGAASRAAAALALGRAGAEEALAPLLEAFASSQDPTPFAEALSALGRARPALEVGEALAARVIFGEECSPRCRALAATLLAELGARGAEELLRAWAESEEPALRRAARRALKGR